LVAEGGDPPVPSNGILDTIQSMRRILMRPGDVLVYQGRGLDIDIPKTNKDVKNGPKPRSFTFDPLGGGNAAWVTWVVEFTLPAGSCPTPRDNGIASFTYQTQFSTTHEGLVTRVINGKLVIAQSRLAFDNRKVTDIADAYTARVLNSIPVPDGFRRDSTQREVSTDGSTVTFHITDRQLPVPLPEFVIEANVTYSQSSSGVALNKWTSTLSGTYTLKPGVPKSKALFVFAEEAKRRIKGQTKNGVKQLIPQSLSMSEDVYGLSAGHISLSWTWFVHSDEKKKLPDYAKILPQSALWLPIPKTGFKKWAATLQDVWDPRGLSGMTALASSQVVVDFCNQETPTIKDSLKPLVELQGVEIKFPKLEGAPYLHVRSSLHIDALMNLIRQKVLPAALGWVPAPVRLVGNFLVEQVGAALPGVQDLFGGPGGARGDDQPDGIQRRASPSFAAVLEGVALRAGAKVVPPRLLSIGGVAAILFREPTFAQKIVGNRGGIPIWAAKWYFPYLLPSSPRGEAGAPENQSLLSDGGAA